MLMLQSLIPLSSVTRWRRPFGDAVSSGMDWDMLLRDIDWWNVHWPTGSWLHCLLCYEIVSVVLRETCRSGTHLAVA